MQASNPDVFHRHVESNLKKITTEPRNIKLLGETAGHLKILGRLDESDALFAEVDSLLSKDQIKENLVNFLRWSDTKRYAGDFKSAREMLDDCEEMIRKNSPLASYEDFHLQHLGKLYFDLREYAKALECFEKALRLRLQKNQNDLIESTEFAIQQTKLRMNP